MSTYKELLAQRAELEKKIEAERAAARATALTTHQSRQPAVLELDVTKAGFTV